MQDHKAKMDMLKQLMDMMDGHRLGGLKKKGAPAAMSVEVQKMDAAPVATSEEAAPQDDGMDEDTVRQLVEMYGKKDDDKKEEDLSIDGFVPMG